jgi:hypothetical protein
MSVRVGLGSVAYARVSAVDQNADLQHAALQAAGWQRIFTHHGGNGTRLSDLYWTKCSSTCETETNSWSGSWSAAQC